MAYNYEYPMTDLSRFNADELYKLAYESLEKLNNPELYIKEVLDKIIPERLTEILDKVVFDAMYVAETETIKFIPRGV